MKRSAQDGKSFLFLALAAAIACAVFYFWGQYNTASTIYEVGFMQQHIDELLTSAEGYARSEEEQALYDSLCEGGASWEAYTEKIYGSYETATAAKWFGESARRRLAYSQYGQGSDRTVILLHDIAASDVAIWASVWWNEGFNVVIPEMRGDSREESDIVTYGVYEQYDVYDLIVHLGLQDSCVWLQGRGSGAAAAIFLAGNTELADAGIDGIVSESVYDNFAQTQRTLVKQLFHLGDNFVGRFLRYQIKTNLCFDPESVIVSNYAEHCEIPMLFLCSRTDGFLDPAATEAVYAAAAGPKELCQTDAHHLLLAGAEGYPCQEAIRQFIEKYA